MIIVLCESYNEAKNVFYDLIHYLNEKCRPPNYIYANSLSLNIKLDDFSFVFCDKRMKGIFSKGSYNTFIEESAFLKQWGYLR